MPLISGRLPGRVSIINFAGRPRGRATIARVRAACRGSPASQVSALRYLALTGAGHASRQGTGQHDRPVHHRARHRACGGRLRGIAERAVACGGAGLRGERVHAQGPEGLALGGQRLPLPARAPPAQVKFADPGNPVRRAGRGSASITRLIHLRPPPGPVPGPGASPLHRIDCSSSHLLSRLGRMAAIGHHRPVRSSIRDEVRAFRRASATRFRRWRAPRARGGGRGCRPPGAPGRRPATRPRSGYRGPAGRG